MRFNSRVPRPLPHFGEGPGYGASHVTRNFSSISLSGVFEPQVQWVRLHVQPSSPRESAYALIREVCQITSLSS